MRIALSAAAVTTLISTCNPSGGEPEPEPLYDCAHMFDDSCRFEAEVTWDQANLWDAYITWEDGVTETSAFLSDLDATIVLHDTTGVLPDVTCSVDTNLGVESVYENGQYTTDTWGIMGHDCPVSCPWFMPTDGTFDADEGRFSIGYFEGQFDLQWGPYGSDPSWSEIAVQFQLSESTFEDGFIELGADAAAYPTSYTVPVALSGNNAPSACSF